MPKQIIQSQTIMEYVIDDTDDLGIYTFTVESKMKLAIKLQLIHSKWNSQTINM